MTTSTPENPGRLGDYSLLENLGHGPYCTVWRGRRGAAGPDVALKVLKPFYAENPTVVAHFEREARLAQTLAHPHIVRVHEVRTCPEAGLPFFVMDFHPGGNLGRFRGAPAAQFPAVVRILGEVCAALDYLHGRSLVHCDVKASNVLLDGADRSYLADFGMAASPEQLAQEGAAGGTIGYMPPEQFESLGAEPGAGRVDARSDLYALGVLMYEIFTGERPFKGANRFALLYQRLKAPPRPPSELRDDIPPPLADVILKAMARDPADRFQSAAELGAALRA